MSQPQILKWHGAALYDGGDLASTWVISGLENQQESCKNQTKLIDDIEVDIENDRYFAGNSTETIIRYAKAA